MRISLLLQMGIWLVNDGISSIFEKRGMDQGLKEEHLKA
jgi:hypothetical protein